MKNILKILSGCLAAFALFAPNVRAVETNSAAQSWQSLTNFSLSPPPMSWMTNPPAQIELEKFDDRRADESAMLAEKAKSFYTRFPDDANTARARVTEIQALQMAVRLGATNRLNDLLAREQSLVQDTNAPTELRYELRLDLVGRDLKTAEASGAEMNAALEKAGRALVKEFPSGPAGYEILGEVAESADLAKMRELGDLMANSGGPKELTDAGKGLLHRLDIVGKPLPIEFTAADGREINSTTLSNKVVLVDFWATWCPHCVEMAPGLKKLYDKFHADGFEIVGINFDDETNSAQRFIKEQNLPWPQFFGGRDNKYGKDYALNFLPAVWLADRKGIVCDIHGTMDLEAKVEKLMVK